jgi:hypothetical protein
MTSACASRGRRHLVPMLSTGRRLAPGRFLPRAIKLEAEEPLDGFWVGQNAGDDGGRDPGPVFPGHILEDVELVDDSLRQSHVNTFIAQPGASYLAFCLSWHVVQEQNL